MIRLKCIKEPDDRLRIRITTPGYYHEANCQFPRDLREEGRLYDVDSTAVKLITSHGKYFYSIRQKKAIKIVSDAQIREETQAHIANLSVYEDTTTSECTICMEAPKSIILMDCGHFYTCHACSEKIQKCPICRASIKHRINKSDMG